MSTPVLVVKLSEEIISDFSNWLKVLKPWANQK